MALIQPNRGTIAQLMHKSRSSRFISAKDRRPLAQTQRRLEDWTGLVHRNRTNFCLREAEHNGRGALLQKTSGMSKSGGANPYPRVLTERGRARGLRPRI